MTPFQFLVCCLVATGKTPHPYLTCTEARGELARTDFVVPYLGQRINSTVPLNDLHKCRVLASNDRCITFVNCGDVRTVSVVPQLTNQSADLGQCFYRNETNTQDTCLLN